MTENVLFQTATDGGYKNHANDGTEDSKNLDGNLAQSNRLMLRIGDGKNNKIGDQEPILDVAMDDYVNVTAEMSEDPFIIVKDEEPKSRDMEDSFGKTEEKMQQKSGLDMEQLGDENIFLKTLLGDLHKYVTSHTEGTGSTFETSSTIKSDTPINTQYQQALDIYNNFKEMERVQRLVSDLESVNALNKQLQSDCEKLQKAYDKMRKQNKKLHKSVEDMDRSVSQDKQLVSDLEKRVQSLMLDLESTNTVNKQLQGDCEKLQNTNDYTTKENKKLQKSVQDMDRSLSEEKNTVSRLQKRVQSLESDLESTSTVNKQLYSDCEKLQKYDNIQKKSKQLEKSVQDMKRSLSHEKETVLELQKSLQTQKEVNTATDEKWNLDRQLLKKYVDSLEMTQKQVATYQQREAQLKAAYDGEVLKTRIQKKQIFDLQGQRDEMLNKLSKLAGDTLTHENTNITDLSDPDRPTKLSETYSELYDNEWTDAFEELMDRGLTDIVAVEKLRDMLLVTFHKCREITWERYRSLKSIVSTIDIVHVLPCMRGFPEPEQKTKSTSTESELSSHKPNNTNISIHLEARTNESEEKQVVETSEPMEWENEREQQGKREPELITK